MDFAASQAAFAEALLDPARPLPEGITSVRGTCGIGVSRHLYPGLATLGLIGDGPDRLEGI